MTIPEKAMVKTYIYTIYIAIKKRNVNNDSWQSKLHSRDRWAEKNSTAMARVSAMRWSKQQTTPQQHETKASNLPGWVGIGTWLVLEVLYIDVHMCIYIDYKYRCLDKWVSKYDIQCECRCIIYDISYLWYVYCALMNVSVPKRAKNTQTA